MIVCGLVLLHMCLLIYNTMHSTPQRVFIISCNMYITPSMMRTRKCICIYCGFVPFHLYLPLPYMIIDYQGVSGPPNQTIWRYLLADLW